MHSLCYARALSALEATSTSRTHLLPPALTRVCSGSYILGPLKSRLAREIGTSNAQFSLLVSAFSLNSTWTPLVGGLLASYLGTAVSSIIATSIILLGQAILLAGELTSNVTAMTVGMVGFVLVTFFAF